MTDRPVIILRSDAPPTIPGNYGEYKGDPIFVYYNGSSHYDAFILHKGYEAKDILKDILSEDYSSLRLESNDVTQFSEHNPADTTAIVEVGVTTKVLSEETLASARAVLKETGELSSWGRHVESDLREILNDQIVTERLKEEKMSRQTPRGGIRIIRKGNTVEGDSHVGTMIETHAGDEKGAAEAAALFDRLTAETRRDVGESMAIEINEQDTRIKGRQTTGLIVKTTRTRSSSAIKSHIAPDSPFAPLSSTTPSTMDEHFTLVKDDGNYRVDISYSAFGDTEAEKVMSIVESYMKRSRCYVDGTPVQA